MDIRRLEAFTKVYELRSFSKAGQELYLSQPTISSHISALEEELDALLFDRLGRSIMPTQAADILYRHTQKVFLGLESANAEILLLQERVGGMLRIGGSTIPAHYVLPRLFAGFTSKHRDVRIELSVGDSKEISQRVVSGELALGLVGAQGGESDLVYDPVMDDELILISAPGEYDSRQSLKPTQLPDLPWVIREDGSGTRAAFESALALHGMTLQDLDIMAKVDSTQAVLQCVRAGLGVSVTSRLAAKDFLAAGKIEEVMTQGISIPRTFFLIYHARRHQFPVVRYFSKFIHEGAAAGV